MNKSTFLGFGSTALTIPTTGINIYFSPPVGGITIRNTGANSICVVPNIIVGTGVFGNEDTPFVPAVDVFPAGTQHPTAQEFRRTTINNANAYAFLIAAGGVQRFSGFSPNSAGPLIKSLAIWALVGASAITGGQDDIAVG